MTLFNLVASYRKGMIQDHKAQSIVWGFLAMMVFVAVASGLVDIYRLYAARNWAYGVAQEAAMTGASRGRDWTSISSGGNMRLNESVAMDETQKMISAEMAARGISQYVLDVRVLPGTAGGSITGYPPHPVRLGSGMGNWSSNEPAVGVYLEVPVNWLLLETLDAQVKTIRVFAAAGVAQ
jgi:hypothetical protein